MTGSKTSDWLTPPIMRPVDHNIFHGLSPQDLQQTFRHDVLAAVFLGDADRTTNVAAARRRMLWGIYGAKVAQHWQGPLEARHVPKGPGSYMVYTSALKYSLGPFYGPMYVLQM